MKLRYIIIAGLALAAFTSCNQFLTVDAPSKYDNSYVFSDESEINRALNGVYAQMLNSNTYGQAYLTTFCLNSDVDMAMFTSDVSTNDSYRRFDCTSQGGAIANTWNAAYKGVEYANNFIYQLENCDLFKEGADEDLYQMLGEAKVMRAMFYHDLICLFGDIPFSMSPMAGSNDNQSLLLPVTDRQKAYDALIADLKEIAPKMQFASALSSGIERPSKEFCWAMIARMALSCGGYSLRPDSGNSSSYGTMKRPDNYLDYYKTARDYCDSVIVSGTHSLNLPFYKVFVNECNYIVVNNDDPIFEIPFAQNASGNIGYIQGPAGGLYEGNSSGKNIWGGTSGNARLSALYRFMFDEDDLRRDFVNGLWYYQYDGTPVLLNDRTVYNNKWSKFWSTSSLGTNSQGNTGINYPYMRYADVLLMYAEAVNEIDGGVGGADGAKAIDALRQVRSRAFEDDAKVEAYLSEVSASKESFLKAVLDERKFEFAGENMRWKDLVRNNMYSEELYWSFLRYYGVAENGVGSSDYLEPVSLHDGKAENFWESIPYDIYYMDEQANPGDVTVYPNTTLDIVTFYDNCLYKSCLYPGGDWKQASLFGWYNDTDGCPEDRMLYSFYGYIRADQSGVIKVVRDGALEDPKVDDLPPVRYIIPYPSTAIQRSAGVYKNSYGYN